MLPIERTGTEIKSDERQPNQKLRATALCCHPA